jgi:hypothetical protein
MTQQDSDLCFATAFERVGLPRALAASVFRHTVRYGRDPYLFTAREL